MSKHKYYMCEYQVSTLLLGVPLYALLNQYWGRMGGSPLRAVLTSRIRRYVGESVGGRARDGRGTGRDVLGYDVMT